MNLSRRAFVLLAVLVPLAACGDSDSTAPEQDVTIADLVGSWSASSHLFTNNANPSETFDIVTDGGGETRTTLLANGGARTWVEFGTFMDEWDAQVMVSGNTITSTPAEASRDTRVWTFTLEGDVLTLTDTSTTFDFTLMGGPEVSATEVVTFVRQ